MHREIETVSIEEERHYVGLRRYAIAISVVGAILVSNVPTAYAGSPTLNYAPKKVWSSGRGDRQSLRLALPANELPRRGMLVVTGNILSPEANWIVVDIDRRTISSIVTRLDGSTSGGLQMTITSRHSHPLSDFDRSAAVSAANDVWRMAETDQTLLGDPTDRLCSVVILDGDDVLHEFGSTCPRRDFVALLSRISRQTEADRE